MCKLSVIVPVYNTKDHLEQCIDSILKQSFEDIELILVDDGSTDGSADICDACAGKDRRVKVYHKENSGPLLSRKLGVEKAVGDYVTFVDSDDFVAELSFALASEDMSKGIDVIAFGYMSYFEKDNIQSGVDLYSEGIYSRGRIEKTIYPTMIWDAEEDHFGLPPSLGNKIFKRSLLSDQYEICASMERFHYGEDMAIVYPLIMNVNTLSIHHEAYYYYRQRAGDGLPSYILDERYFDKLYILYKYLKQAFSGQEMFMKQIDLFYIHSAVFKGIQYGRIQQRPDQVFPFDKVSRGEKIVLYGAGNVGRLYRAQLSAIGYCEVVLWVDKNHEKYAETVKAPSEIGQADYEKIVIAIEREETREQVRRTLIEMGVPAEAIII